MRDENRLKERRAFSVEPKQIFSLFVLLSVLLAMVFALGVWVGRRSGFPLPPQDAIEIPAVLSTNEAETPLPIAQVAPSKERKKAQEPKDADTPAEASGAVKKSPKSPKLSQKKRSDRSLSKGRYTVQVSAFQDRSEAEALSKQLKEAGWQPYIVKVSLPNRGLWYRVRFGHYKNKEEAMAAKKNFEKEQERVVYVTKK